MRITLTPELSAPTAGVYGGIALLLVGWPVEVGIGLIILSLHFWHISQPQ
jgi:hypothetical protein